MKYFLFDKAQKYVTRINTEYLIEAHYTEEINTAGQLEFTLPATMRLPENVFYVCVTDPDDETSYLMFKIVTEKVTDEKVTYTCIENAYDELASYTYIKDKRPTAIASAMLQMVLDGTRWSVGACPEVSPKFCSFYYISVLEAIQKIVNLWGFEVQFQVKIDGITNEIKQRNINLYTKLGKRTNKRFEYGSNLLSVTQANDSTGLYTALVGRGKGVQVSSGDTDTDPDGYGRRITFADVVWSTQSGNPLNKPAGQEYLEDPNATAAYGFPDGHPRIGFVTFQDCEDPNELIQLTYDKLQEVNHPQVQFSASIANVGSLDLGDTIAIVRHDIGIEYYTRVFKVVHDLLDSSNNTVELGDNIAGSNSITQQISNIQSNQSNVQNAIDTIVMSGSDGNKLFFGTDFPANGTDGDIFYKTLENGGTEMYIYKDGGWQLVVSTEELNAVQKKVDEQTSQIQQAVQDANAASAKADGLVAQVGDANTNAQKALTTAQQNQADLTQAKNQLSSAISDISQTKQRLSDLTTQAQTQGQTIVNIQKTQSGLTADIADVKGNVSSLQDTANSLQSSIADNKNNIASIKQTVNGLESTVQGNSGQISQLKQTSTSMTSTIASLQSRGDNMFINPKFDGKSPWQCGSSVSITDDSYMGGKVVDLKKGNGSNYLAQANFGLQPEHWYKVEIFAKGTNGNEKLHIEFRSGKYQSDFTVTTDWQLYTLSGKVAKIEDPNLIKIYIWNNSDTDIKVAMPGCTPWGMDYDESTALQQDVSKIDQQLDSISSTVYSHTGDISSLKQRADSMESNISNNKGDISDLRQTTSSLQSNIQSKVDISQFTQLSNAFQTVVQNIGPFYPDGDFSDTDLSKYYDPWDTCTNLDNFSVVTNNSDWGYYLQIYTPQGTINKMITKEYLPINANYPITFKGKSLLSYVGELKGKFQVYYHFYDSNKNQVGPLYVDWYKYDNNNVWQDFSSTLTPPSGAVYLRIETVLDNSEGSGTYWGALDNLSIENGGATIASKISQMSDDINLRVQKGELLSQINIQAGKTLIQSDKLYLDASSVVFSGNAFIPSAAITDLSADKITTGTLNAANVHVINMDVANLVGDTESFVRSQWQSAYGAYVNIDSDGMSVGYGNFKTSFNTNGMQFISAGEKLGGFSTVGMEDQPSTYQGLMCSVGGDAEFFAIGAQDYHNTGQNPIPPKLVWMRYDVDKSGYMPGWNFQDGVWTDQIGINSINHGKWNIKFGIVNGSNGFTALTLTSGTGDGFYWGSDGSFGYVTGRTTLYNLRGTQIVNSINSDGTCQNWTTI